MEKVIQRRSKHGSDKGPKKENKYTHMMEEEIQRTENGGGVEPPKDDKSEKKGGKAPKNKRIKPLYLGIGILALIILVIEFVTISQMSASQFNENETKRIVQVEQEDAKKYNSNIVIEDESDGNIQIQEFIPATEDGNVISSISDQMEQLKLSVLEKYSGASKKTLIFLKAFQTTVISNVNDIHYYVSVYQAKDRGYDQVEYTELTHQLVFSDTMQPFSIAKLFNNDLAVSNMLVKKALDEAKSKNLSQEQTEKITAQFKDNEWKKRDSSILQDGIRIKYMDEKDAEAEWTFAFTELFPYMNENMIPETEKEHYNDYLATVKEVLGKKRIALSFDDGPRAETTPKVLEILKKYNVHATFYMMGSHVVNNEELVKQIAEEGNELGNHSYSHPLLTKKSAAEIYQEVHDTSEAIAKATGGLKPMSLRPPYGGFNKTVADQAGIAIVNWSIDSYDWKYKDAAKTIERVKETAHNGGILLMHDIHEESVEALPAIIEYLQSEGYELVTVSQLMANQPLKPNYVYFDRVENKPVQ